MAVAGIAVVVFRKLNQPPILGYLIAGLLVGPFTFAHSPVTNTESVRLLADLGLVLLLFGLGLEFGWRRIRQVGLVVLLVGSMEMIIMLTIGYQLGRILGWEPMDSIFLGAAISISSSAILVKVLRDSGRLSSSAGRLIVGILVVEDFAAVLLLTLLSGVASTGAASLADIGPLVIKLAIFALASLTLGAIFVPRIISFVAQFKSEETLLLSALALCFTLALTGEILGISAAAGAFLIGTVIGDTDEAHEVEKILAPVRDVFGALFFVSIGMLIDIFVIKEHLVSALVITVVFMVGKTAANTIGTFVAGQPGRVPVQVGTSMPQMGEFSLAMMKVGVEHNAIAAASYQVLAGATALNTALYPYVVRSHRRVGDLISRIVPPLLQTYIASMSFELQSFKGGFTFDSEFSSRVRRSGINILINVIIVIVLIGTGTFAIRFTPAIASFAGVQADIVGSGIGLATLALCFPSGLAIWRSLRLAAEDISAVLVSREKNSSKIWAQPTLRNIIRDSVMILLLAIGGLWSIPFVAELLSLGALAVPVPVIILLAFVLVTIRALTRIHGYLVQTFSQTLLGEPVMNSPWSAPNPRTDSPTETSIAMESVRPIVESGRIDVSASAAEIVALTYARNDIARYRRRLGTNEIAWEIENIVTSSDYYKVVLEFHAIDTGDADTGQVEIYVDKRGEVQLQQMRRWPTKRGLSITRLAALSSFVVAVAVPAGLGLYYFTQHTL